VQAGPIGPFIADRSANGPYHFFHYDEDLLSDLSRPAWESLMLFLQETVPEKNPIPGPVIAIQTFGDFPGFNPHSRLLVTDGCFLRHAQVETGRRPGRSSVDSVICVIVGASSQILTELTELPVCKSLRLSLWD
jgi:hypothetical protein